MRNAEVAQLLNEIADLLELKGDDPYRIAAYREAARQIENLTEDIVEVWRAGRLDEIPRVGPSIAAKIAEYLETGRLRYLEELRQQVAPGLVELMQVPGVGPRRARLFYEKLGITSIRQLEEAARQHQLCKLPGVREKTEENIRRELERLQARTRRLPLGVALPVAERVIALLKDHPAVRRIDAAGSLRRMRETIGDIDILVASDRPLEVIEAFTHLPIVREVLAKGPAKASVLIEGNFQVDLRVIDPASYGAALQYFTGSKEHNIALRELAIRRGWKLNEYGLFDEATGRRLAGETEEEIYRMLGLVWIPPELRENRGEIEAAMRGELPALVELRDIQGDLHLHTNWSDGTATLEAMAEAARARGYAYIAVTDHSATLGVAGGLSVESLREQWAEIDRLNERLRPFRILKGAEVDILADGSLGYPDEVLAQLEYVAVSVHSGFHQSRERMTQRILRALENPYVHTLNHPTGRLLGKREPYEVDLEAVLQAAAARGICVEIDGAPDRLDLDDLWARRAKEMGCLLVVDSDAHSVPALEGVRYGVAVARRGWLEKKDILNTRPLAELLAWLERRRALARPGGR
jgi:DNA polymerase (family 10)